MSPVKTREPHSDLGAAADPQRKEPNPRILPFDRIENFRDFGGYALAGGGRLAAGRLFRSAHHGRATPEDLQRLQGLDLATVVDLRRPDERARDPCRRPSPFGARVIETALEPAGEAPHLKFLREAEVTPAGAHAFMIEEYRRLPFDPAHLDLFARYFAAIAEGDGPMLIHCAAGKDRTGLLVALTHLVAGVHADDLMADYLLTNAARRFADWVERFGDQVEREYGRRPSDPALEAFLRVHPAWLETAFDAMAERHGDVDGYLEQALGVGGEARARVRARLTEAPGARTP